MEACSGRRGDDANSSVTARRTAMAICAFSRRGQRAMGGHEGRPRPLIDLTPEDSRGRWREAMKRRRRSHHLRWPLTLSRTAAAHATLSHEHVPPHRIASACYLPCLYLSRISTDIFLIATTIAGSRCQQREGGGVECGMVCAFCLLTADLPSRVRPQQLAGNCVSRSQRDLSAVARKQSVEPGRALY